MRTGAIEGIVDRLNMSRNKNKNRIDRRPNGLDDQCPSATSFPAAGRSMRSDLVWPAVLMVLAAGIGVVQWKGVALCSVTGHMIRCAVAITAPTVSEADAAVRQAPLPMPAQPLAVKNQIPENINESPISTVEKSPPVLEELHLVQVGEQLRMAATFSHMPGYRLFRRDRGKHLVLELPEGTTVPSLPDGELPPLLKKLSRETLDGRVRLIFCFDRVCRCEEQGLRNKHGEEGRALFFAVRPEPVTVVPTTAPAGPLPTETPASARVVSADTGQAPVPAPAPAARTFIRQAVQTTNRQHAEDLYREAAAAIQQGRPAKAERALRTALEVYPGHIDARDALLHLLHRLNRRQQVKALLAQGVRERPDHPPYRARWVRLLIDDNELFRARAELTRIPLPPVAEAPDLHAMSATVSLRQGRYQDAAQTYRNLLTVQPDQAVWWMGLGIALEGDAAFDRARRAYDQALRHDGLSDTLQTFIRRRLAASGNGQAGQPLAGRDHDEEQS